QQTSKFGLETPRENNDELLGKIAQPRYASGNGQSARTQRHISKGWVAAKKLIAAEARDRHFQSKLPCGFANEPFVEPVDLGLVHGFENSGQIVQELLLCNCACRVSRAILRSDFCGDRGLILAPAPKFFESKCYRLDVLLSRVAHEANK